MKIKSKIDIITNSSSECYIQKIREDGFYDQKIETWNDIYQGGTCDMWMDILVFLLEKIIGKTLINNPFPVDPNNISNDPWCYGGIIIKPWEKAYEELGCEKTMKLLENFVSENKDAFSELLGIGFYSGPDDNELSEEIWEVICDENREDSIFWISRGETLWEKAQNYYL